MRRKKRTEYEETLDVLADRQPCISCGKKWPVVNKGVIIICGNCEEEDCAWYMLQGNNTWTKG